MTKGRSNFNLLVVRGELYAVGGDCGYFNNTTSIEKLDKVSGEWRVVTELGEGRNGCGAACMGSKIYVFGGGLGGNDSTTWNFFDVETEEWASASTSVVHRQLPREFGCCSAVVVPSSNFTYTSLFIGSFLLSLLRDHFLFHSPALLSFSNKHSMGAILSALFCILCSVSCVSIVCLCVFRYSQSSGSQ